MSLAILACNCTSGLSVALFRLGLTLTHFYSLLVIQQTCPDCYMPGAGNKPWMILTGSCSYSASKPRGNYLLWCGVNVQEMRTKTVFISTMLVLRPSTQRSPSSREANYKGAQGDFWTTLVGKKKTCSLPGWGMISTYILGSSLG